MHKDKVSTVTPVLQGTAVLVGALLVFSIFTGGKDHAVDTAEAANSTSQWGFEESTGNAAIDLSNLNNGTLFNGPTRINPGKVGRGLRFDGINDYVSFGDGSTLESQNFSFSIWVKRNGAQPDWAKIFNKGRADVSPWASYKLEFHGASDTTVNFHMGFTDGSSHVVQNQTPLASGVWTHLVGTWNGTDIKLYMNGVLQGTNSIGNKTVMFDSVPLTLGGYAGWGYSALDVDEFRYFNYALSGAEVSNVYAESPSVAVTSPNTAATWVLGTTKPITWNHNLPAGSTSKVEISRNGGSTWTQLTANAINGNGTGTSNWPVSGTATTQGRMRVTGNNTLATDSSDVNFTVANPALTVTSPNAASDKWTIGTQATVNWTGNLETSENVKIELSTNGGSTYPIVLAASTPSDGNETVTVSPAWAGASTRVRVSRLNLLPAAFDASDANFTVSNPSDTTAPSASITSPANNTVISSPTTITATATDNVSVAGVQFKVDGTNLGSEDTSSPYTATFNPALYPMGNHTLSAVARDTAGNLGASPDVTVITPMASKSFAPSSAAIINPERGFYKYEDITSTWPLDYVRTVNGQSMIKVYVRLDSWRDQSLPQSFLDEMNVFMAKVRGSSLKAVLRFTYNFGPNDGDATPARMVEHISQLAPVFQSNVDVISSVEAGFVGAWGEWHSATNGSDSPATKLQVVQALMNAVPASRMIGIRYPAELRNLQASGPITAAEAFNGSFRSRLASHMDCFLASNEDWGTWGLIYDWNTQTWGPDGYTVAQDKQYISDNARYSVVGGETCNPNSPRSDCPTAKAELESLHWSYISDEYEPNVIQGWKNGGCFDEIANRLGYRFTLNSSTYSGIANAGGKLEFNAQLTNSGYASLYNRRPAYLVLKSGANRYEFQLSSDPRFWASGATVNLNEAFTLPSDIVPGTYTLALWMPDDSSTLRNNPLYSVQFANLGIWDQVEGYNIISNSVTVN